MIKRPKFGEILKYKGIKTDLEKATELYTELVKNYSLTETDINMIAMHAFAAEKRTSQLIKRQNLTGYDGLTSEAKQSIETVTEEITNIAEKYLETLIRDCCSEDPPMDVENAKKYATILGADIADIIHGAKEYLSPQDKKGYCLFNIKPNIEHITDIPEACTSGADIIKAFIASYKESMKKTDDSVAWLD